MGNGIFDMGGFVEVWCWGSDVGESLFSCVFGGGGEVMLGFLWVRSLKNLLDKGAVLDK